MHIETIKNGQVSKARDYLWRGDSKYKGLGVFSRISESLRALPWQGEFTLPPFRGKPSRTYPSEYLKLFLPASFGKYRILAVWTKNDKREPIKYIEQFWHYLQIHKRNLAGDNSVVIGDFNSNAIWDKKHSNKIHGNRSHSAVVAELKSIGVESIYHRQYNEEHGQETQASFYQNRNAERGYHIDYAFCSQNLQNKAKLELGRAADWRKLSDHMLLIIDIAD